MKRRFIGKNVMITGASSGIGAATALEFAREGANLALVARNADRLDSVKKKCEEFGVKVACFIADVSVKEEISKAVSDAISAFGKIDVLHANAGIYLRCEAKDLKIEQIERIMEVNFYGNLNTVYAILPHMLENKGGSIISTCSMDGKKGVPPDAAYVASKFAMNGFHQVLRQEVKKYGIHIGLIFPSRTDTPQIAHVATPSITPKANPSKIAKAVVKCALKKKKEMMVPRFSCRLLEIGEFISPSLGDWMVKAFKLDGVETGESVVKEKGL